MSTRLFTWFCQIGWWVALFAATGVGGSPSPTTNPVAADAMDTAGLVARIVKHPADQSLWALARQPQHIKEARRLLVAAFRDPANARKEPTRFVRVERGRDDLLEAIAGIFGDDSADVLIEGAQDADPEVRCEAMAQTWRVKTPTPELRKAIRQALKDSDGYVVSHALDAVARYYDSEAGPQVLELLRHPTPIRARRMGYTDDL